MTTTKRPFLGRSRVNRVIGAINSILKTQVKVVSLVGNANSPALETSTQPSWVITEKSSILTIPIPVASSGTNTNTPGWHWTAGSRNYNPASTYQDQTLVFVSPSSTVVTTGLPDIDTGHTEKSVAGVWVALKTVVPSGTNYHVPRLPLPVPEDMDSSSNYWLLVSQAPQCL